MEKLSEKVFLSLKMPTEDAPVSDQRRIQLALETLGYSPVQFPIQIIKKIYPMCRKAGFDVTVSLVHREYDWVVTDVEPGDTTQNHYGIAVDYGSTTIIMQLVDMNTGVVIGEEKAVNKQTGFGTDILTRITYAMEAPSHIRDIQKATVETFGELLAQLVESTGIRADRCPVMVIAGNTTMIHFLLQLDAWTVFAAPYAPVSGDPGFFWGKDLDMDFDGLVYIIPAASNYVGGDIVSGLLMLGIHKSEEAVLFFDIGTNGELVIGNKDWILAGAGAAGPALEGYISRYGMRAAEGAIDTVTIRGKDIFYTTIGNTKPAGICGSGIIDLLAQMRLNGWINMAGILEPGASDRIQRINGELVAVYATAEESVSGQTLYFSQTDIMQYLDTKAAAYTMVECLMEMAGVRESDLSRLYLSGAFSYYSDLESAITIGIFPDIPREKYMIQKNTSLDGARVLLLNYGLVKEARELSENMYCVQFASIPDFLNRMQAAKFIPHTDMGRYPRISERLT